MQYAQVPSGAVIGAQVPGCGPKQKLTNDAALTNINDYGHFQGQKTIISQLRLDQENESRTRAALPNKQSNLFWLTRRHLTSADQIMD